jgi:hypothetical protein
MLAVVKKPRTKLPDLELRGKIPGWIIVRLKKEHGKCFRILDENEGEEEFVDLLETAWYKKMKRNYKSGQRHSSLCFNALRINLPTIKSRTNI